MVPKKGNWLRAWWRKRGKARAEKAEKFMKRLEERLLGPAYGIDSELALLEIKAVNKLKKDGKGQDVQKAKRMILGGRIAWIPGEKRNAALLFVVIKAAGIRIPKEKLKALGIEDIAPSLEKTAENLFY